MTRRIGVIGGGAAGLATAALLAREGHTVDLFEQNSTLGGRIGSIERDGYRFDTGPSWYLMPEVFEHFFNLVGTTAAAELDLRTLDPAYTVFSPASASSHAQTITIPQGQAQVLEAFERIERGSGRSLNRYLASANRTKNMAIDYFLYNPFTSPMSMLRSEIMTALPTLVRLLGTSLERFSSTSVRHPVLRQILQYPAIFLGTDPRKAPAIYHLMSALDLGDGVQYPMGGFRTIVDALTRIVDESGVRVHTNAAVRHISAVPQRGRRRKVTGLAWADQEGRKHEHRCDVVVSAADLHHTETRLLDHVDQSRPESWWERVTSGPGAILVFLGVEGEIPQLPHHSLFFTDDWSTNFDDIFGPRPKISSPASAYVCKPSHSDPSVAPPDHENLFILIPVPADAGLGAGGRDGQGDPRIERAADRAIDQVAQWADIPDLRDRIRFRQTQGPTDFSSSYNSWLGGMLGPAHTLRQSAMFRQQNVSNKVEGLYYAGATTAPGVGVPMCLISAELVLKRIRGDSSPGPLPIDDDPFETAVSQPL
ncbi:phytoene desaturase family protein [Brevibacterium sandarakinum]|uniref:phytoene desaturase family protein n=1 Tax=Brevibacterium sandarakinum TaxID=629680 RepID=UPI002652E044|nr:phytoene desaturase family protein [Brevibacterium sandarakinum]MDN5657620.1 phytoene desaturase family protein [Brevibacterium sandarakinum]